VIVVGASVSSSEIIHEILPYAKHPVIGALRGAPIPAFGLVPWTHPHVVVKQQITKLDAGTGRVSFADGSHVDDVDHIVFGTGYTFSLPYLPRVQEKIKGAYRRLPGVYQHTWNIEDPSLVFVGMVRIAASLTTVTALSNHAGPLLSSVEASPSACTNGKQLLLPASLRAEQDPCLRSKNKKHGRETELPC